jgi:hypothetical protein
MENSFTRPEGMKILVLVQTTLPGIANILPPTKAVFMFRHNVNEREYCGDDDDDDDDNE